MPRGAFVGWSLLLFAVLICGPLRYLRTAEAMMNGIPVLGSTRGALPEVIGDAGLLLDIPARMTPTSRELPSVEEVRPWVEAIVRLWDDVDYYQVVSDRCRARVALWSPEVVVEQFERAIGG